MFLMHNMELTKESVFYHNPMGYNGRVSSILPTATDFKRPRGFFKDYTSGNADFMPSKKLDYEMEMGFIMAGSVPVGERLSADKAWDHIFGFVLLNDWSARDILAYEMVPAGPFNGKASAASVSPWVIMPEAIASSSWGRPRNQTEGHVPSYLAHSSLESTVPAIDFNVYIARESRLEENPIDLTSTDILEQAMESRCKFHVLLSSTLFIL